MKCNKNNYYLLVIAILAVMLLLSILSFFRKDSARNLETIKVGGVENMVAVQELYKSDSYKAQQTAAIDQALAQINLEQDMEVMPPEVDGENMEEDLGEEIEENVAINNDMINTLESIKESTVIHGDKDARFTILEYSEFLCPYCKRQSDNGTINDVLDALDGEVNASFRNFIVHDAASQLGEGVECMKEFGKESKYFEFIENMFAYEGTLDINVIVDIADDLGVNEKDMKACLESGKYSDMVREQTAEGRNLFGVSGTPGNVIVDKQTGKFVLIPGAYPAEKFIEEIEKMKAE